MPTHHHYRVGIDWTGNRGGGTASYAAYDRSHTIRVAGKPDIPGSSDPAFRGDRARWNPEELLVASVAACHQLWYLHLASSNGIVVKTYKDLADGTMIEDADGGGRFAKIVLRPVVTIATGGDPDVARRLHHDANAKCFIAASVNFPIEHEPTIIVEAGADA